VTQFGPRDLVTNFKFKEIHNGGSRHPKKLKIKNLGNGLTDRHSIWHMMTHIDPSNQTDQTST